MELKKSSQEQANIRCDFTGFPIEDKLVYFRLEHNVDLPDSAPRHLREHFKPSVHCGFATREDVEKYLAEQITEVPIVPQMYIAPQGFKEMAQKETFPTAIEKFGYDFRAKADRIARFQDGTVNLDDVIIVDVGSHMLFDRNGTVLPTGLFFDFCTGNFHNGAYRLDVALKLFKEDPRISPAPDSRKRDDTPEVLRIERVSERYYGDTDKESHIRFIFSPTKEDMKKIWEKCKSYGTDYPSTRMREAIFDLDIMGLRAGGAAKYNGFYDQDEYHSDDDE